MRWPDPLKAIRMLASVASVARFTADSAFAMQLQLPHVPVPVSAVTKFVALRQGEGQTIPFPIYAAHLGVLVHETAEQHTSRPGVLKMVFKAEEATLGDSER
jgi:hypothetical protein